MARGRSPRRSQLRAFMEEAKPHPRSILNYTFHLTCNLIDTVLKGTHLLYYYFKKILCQLFIAVLDIVAKSPQGRLKL